MELLESIHDPRAARGKRHPLPALLALAVVGMLAGLSSYEGIVQFGKERGGEFLRQLGFTTRWGLCKATYSRVFGRLDIEAFEAAVAAWIGSQLTTDDARHLAIDGKSLRGSREAGMPAAHLVAAYAVDAGAVMAQLRVDAKTNEHKAALELLGILPIDGRVISGDAMFTHRDVCTQIIDGGGDYVFVVKDNQPNLLADIKAVFAEPTEGLSPPPGRTSCSEFRPLHRGR
jgi:DDE family transposase